MKKTWVVELEDFCVRFFPRRLHPRMRSIRRRWTTKRESYSFCSARMRVKNEFILSIRNTLNDLYCSTFWRRLPRRLYGSGRHRRTNENIIHHIHNIFHASDAQAYCDRQVNLFQVTSSVRTIISNCPPTRFK